MSNLALLQTYAPYVYLHPDEKYFPADIDWYLQRVTMKFQYYYQDGGTTLEPVLTHVTPDNIAIQIQEDARGTHHSGYQAGQPSSDISDNFLLDINDTASTYPGQPLQRGACTAPVYAAVIPGPQYTDLLYVFFYPYNGAAMNDPGLFGTHQADWEHVIVRLGSDGATIIGAYFQAHGADDPYSRWYAPPPAPKHAPVLQFAGIASNRIVVYSGLEGHASYPRAGSWNYGARGNDVTAPGPPWNTADHVVEISVTHPGWNQYRARWGGKVLTRLGPPGPRAQGWFQLRTDGPIERTEVVVSREAARGQSSRVSQNFHLDLPNSWLLVEVQGLPAQALTTDGPQLSFTIAEDLPGPDKGLVFNLSPGTEFPGTFANRIRKNARGLYIANLCLTSANGSEERFVKVFDYLGIDQFTIIFNLVPNRDDS